MALSVTHASRLEATQTARRLEPHQQAARRVLASIRCKDEQLFGSEERGAVEAAVPELCHEEL